MARDRRDDDRYYDEDDHPRDRYRDDRDDDRSRGRHRDDDRDDRPRYREDDDRRRPEPTNGAAMTSLILGIVSFVGGLTSIPGLICGFVGLSKASKLGGAGKGMAVAGTITSFVGLGVLGLTIWLAVTYVFVPRDSSAVRMSSSNNLKQIGLAMHNFHDSNGFLPTPYARSPFGMPGQPVRESELGSKLSWRVELLPYIEQGNLYSVMQTTMNEPWDSASNRPHASVRIPTYMDPDTRDDPDTRYRVFYGPETAFPLDGRMNLARMFDGSSNTIFAVESGEKVTWTRFAEMKFDPSNPPDPSKMGRPVSDRFMVVMGDASTRTFRKTMNPQVFKAAITANGGEVINLDD